MPIMTRPTIPIFDFLKMTQFCLADLRRSLSLIRQSGSSINSSSVSVISGDVESRISSVSRLSWIFVIDFDSLP